MMYTALLLDDEKPEREGIARHVNFADYGFAPPVLCVNGWEALAYMKKAPVDVLLTDICMPGLSGLETMEEARKLNGNLYVVVISGFAEFQYAQQALRLGAREYLLKPVRPGDIHRVLADYVRLRSCPSAEEAPAQASGPVAATLALLEAHVEDGIQIADIAEAIHMNESYLCTLFKKERGETINECLARLQRNSACRYLATTELPVSEIAWQTGRKTASNFVQWFRKQMGMTPAEYRRITRRRES